MEALRRGLPDDGELAAKLVEELLAYDPATGVFVWRPRCGAHSFNARFAGSVAGSANQYGHLQVAVAGRYYQLHRLAWLVAHKRWPEQLLDHINGDPSDNRIENLRPADFSQNAANSSMRSRNRVGLKGVTETPNGKFRAHICWRGHQKSLGMFATKEAAYAAYRKAAAETHGEFGRDG